MSSTPLNNNKTALILTLMGIFGSIILKCSKVISSEITFTTLITLSLAVGLLIFFSHRVETFKLQILEVTLNKVKDSEVSIKEISLALLGVVEQSMSQSLVTEAFDQQAYATSVEKLRKLIS